MPISRPKSLIFHSLIRDIRTYIEGLSSGRAARPQERNIFTPVKLLVGHLALFRICPVYVSSPAFLCAAHQFDLLGRRSSKMRADPIVAFATHCALPTNNNRRRGYSITNELLRFWPAESQLDSAEGQSKSSLCWLT